jgi:hypothetical protein
MGEWIECGELAEWTAALEKYYPDIQIQPIDFDWPD